MDWLTASRNGYGAIRIITYLRRVAWIEWFPSKPCGPASAIVVPSKLNGAASYQVLKSLWISRNHALRELGLCLSQSVGAKRNGDTAFKSSGWRCLNWWGSMLVACNVDFQPVDEFAGTPILASFASMLTSTN